MELAKITSKGQITLPVAIRKILNLKDGDKVAFIEKNGQFILVNPVSLAIDEARNAFDGEAGRLNLKNEKDVVNLVKDVRKEINMEKMKKWELSILIFKSSKLKKLLEVIIDNHQLVMCSFVLDELHEVIKRKFINKESHLDKFLHNISYEIYHTPKKIINNSFYIRDINDIPVIFSAIKSNVDILITGDKDFNDIKIKGIEIVTPSEFLEKSDI